MPWPLPVRYEIAEETRFGDRRLNCFASRPGNVDLLLRGSAANDPKAEAIVDGDRRMTYAALDEAVNKVAANLRNLGLAQGDVEQVLFLCLCLCVSCLYRISRHFEQTVHNGFQT